MEDKISALIEAQAYYQQVEPVLSNVDQALPADPNAVPLMVQLRNLASASGALLTSLQPSSAPLLGQATHSATTPTTSVISSKQQTFDITVGVEGPYINVRSYLAGIIDMRRIVTIDGITITPVKAAETGTSSAALAPDMLQLVLRLKTYYLVQ